VSPVGWTARSSTMSGTSSALASMRFSTPTPPSSKGLTIGGAGYVRKSAGPIVPDRAAASRMRTGLLDQLLGNSGQDRTTA
jgi:hypothetical protein